MDTPVYYETLAAWGWEECTLCLMPERPGGHHTHRAPRRVTYQSNITYQSLSRFARSVTSPERFFIVVD